MAKIYQYGKAQANLLGGESAGDAFAVDYLSDTVKVALLDNGHTPALDTHEVFDDVDGDEIAGPGYSAGGAALASKTLAYTPANSWSPAWAVGTAYQVGDIVRPSAGNGHVYRCIVAGTSHGSVEPTWPTVSGQVVVDNSVTWAEIGRGVTVIDSADPSWSGASFTARYGVVYKDTGNPATSPLLFLIDLEGDVTVTNAIFSLLLPSSGWMPFSTP